MTTANQALTELQSNGSSKTLQEIIDILKDVDAVPILSNLEEDYSPKANVFNGGNYVGYQMGGFNHAA